jgi:hypothetical protein
MARFGKEVSQDTHTAMFCHYHCAREIMHTHSEHWRMLNRCASSELMCGWLAWRTFVHGLYHAAIPGQLPSGYIHVTTSMYGEGERETMPVQTDPTLI